MKTRRFGRTDHHSSVGILGAFAFSNASQAETDAMMEQVIAMGVNHIDVAPSYGEAEARLGPWMQRERKRFFLGCKTTDRSRAGATAELHRSLERLQTETFDLYQLHAVNTMEELDAAFAPGGAIEALVAAREAGLTRFLGITGHGLESPAVFSEALRRFDFDSVLFPINFILYANPDYRRDAEQLLAGCRAKDIGTMIIKALAKGPWGERPKTHNTWYEPFDRMEIIQPAINFALSQDVTGLCSTGDITVLPLFLQACVNFTPLSTAEQADLIARAGAYEPLFV